SRPRRVAGRHGSSERRPRPTQIHRSNKEVRVNNAIVKASKAAKNLNSTVLSHLDAVERAREIYLGQNKRAEADYFERIKRATAIVTGEEAATGEAEIPANAPAPAPTAAPPPDAP